ncbi:MAG: hypothetical protein KGM99_13170, partial [Burkholderiales bacterium]|nr:hypothetical protein [Burkholderiales bacterium]
IDLDYVIEEVWYDPHTHEHTGSRSLAKGTLPTKKDYTYYQITAITVHDDGVGFQNTEQLDFFRVFGAPHQEGDAEFGMFRVGRGQIMSYGQCTWRSHIFEMHTDLSDLKKGQQPSFELKTHPESNSHQGCTVTCTLAHPIRIINSEINAFQNDPTSIVSLLSELKHHLKFVSTPVYIRDVQINQDPRTMQWSHEDAFAYYKFTTPEEKNINWRFQHYMGVYNRGIWVEDFEKSKFGLAGFVVTKQSLAMNMARNSVVYSPQWNHICCVLRQSFTDHIKQLSRIPADQAAKIIHDILIYDFEPDSNLKKALYDAKIIPDVKGTHVSLSQIAQYPRITVVKHDEPKQMIAEAIYKEKSAFVLRTTSLGHLITTHVEEQQHKDRRKQHAENQLMAYAHLFNRLILVFNKKYVFEYVPFRILAEEKSDLYEILSPEQEEAQLTMLQSAALQVIRKYHAKLIPNVRHGNGYARFVSTRKIKVGLSDTAEAWTDSATYICLTHHILDMAAENRFGYIANVLIHEYCHDEGNSITATQHSPEFYENFHNWANLELVEDVVDSMRKAFIREIVKLQINPPSKIGGFIDQLNKSAEGLKRRRSGPPLKSRMLGLQNVTITKV